MRHRADTMYYRATGLKQGIHEEGPTYLVEYYNASQGQWLYYNSVSKSKTKRGLWRLNAHTMATLEEDDLCLINALVRQLRLTENLSPYYLLTVEWPLDDLDPTTTVQPMQELPYLEKAA